ncbi:sensor histidine kinase [Halosolutus gelatinilyticus]|uniref:sensor histidine kinase n=1 Tax=Halosolutus gelatinilyticus TaxID=2931975 RepID=UPI001FF3F82E|nr:PAS domain-containing sensor histidine kinase [Halosolutus gelatinilyticus]
MFSDDIDQVDTIDLLRETWYRMEYALEVTDAVIWDWDHRTNTVTFYPSALGIYGRVVETTDEFLDIVHPDDEERVEAVFESMGSEFGSTTAEFRIRKYGEIRWIEARGRVEEADDGAPVRSVGVARDVTEKKRQELELQEKTERLEEFASVLSHDLRNPLTVAKGYLELAQMDCESEHFEHVAQAHDRMEALIEDLLTLAREGADCITLADVSLAETAAQAWETVDTAAASLRVETDAVIRADRNRLQQLLENLIRNAVEHGGVDVTVRIGDLDDATGFYVEDDGRGIPEAEHEQVFEGGYSTSHEGTGFGLAIVEGIAVSHGWSVAIADSDAGGVRVEVTGVESNE